MLFNLGRDAVVSQTRHEAFSSCAAEEVLECMVDSGAKLDAETTELVLDFVDAFGDAPLAPRERQFFVGIHRGRYYTYLRAAQRSRNGLWLGAGVISSVRRLSQSLFWDSGRCRTRINAYVDEPLTLMRGSQCYMRYAV